MLYEKLHPMCQHPHKHFDLSVAKTKRATQDVLMAFWIDAQEFIKCRWIEDKILLILQHSPGQFTFILF